MDLEIFDEVFKRALNDVMEELEEYCNRVHMGCEEDEYDLCYD